MKQEKMKQLGLFAGGGGFEYAARLMGWEVVAWCEWNEFCQRVLKYHFPEAEGHSDITKTDFTKYKNAVDIITGGFPCQPYSQAGKRKGKADERHLWPEMLRAVREIQPVWVVGENVPGIINWDRGLVFDQVQTDLETEGYEVFPYVLPACGTGAPHRRDRVWFIAYSNGNANRIIRESNTDTDGLSELDREALHAWESPGTATWTNTHTNGIRRERRPSNSQKRAQSINQQSERHDKLPGRFWQNFPTQPPVYNGNDGLSLRLDTTAISIGKWRQESIKAGGNAIVPQVAHQIFKAIEQYEFMKPESG